MEDMVFEILEDWLGDGMLDDGSTDAVLGYLPDTVETNWWDFLFFNRWGI